MSDVPRSVQSRVSTIHGCTHSWRFQPFYKIIYNYTSIRSGQNNRRQLALSSAIPHGKHDQPCMVHGLVLQVRTYCAQYNIRKTTTNSSTIGKENDHSFCRNLTRNAQPTMVYSTAGTYGRIATTMHNTVLLSGLREANTTGGPKAVINSSILVPGFVRRCTARVGHRGDATFPPH